MIESNEISITVGQEETALCPLCVETKPKNEFPRMFREGAKNRHPFCCRSCTKKRHRAICKKWQQDNPEKFNAFRRDYHLKKTYGMRLAEYQERAAKQEHKCAICHKQRKLMVDHCHSSGQIRDLICYHCNVALGHFSDSLAVMTNAIAYLKKHGAKE